MNWNYLAEITSALFVLIILTHSLRYRLLPSRRNTVFIWTVGLVFGLILLSIGTVMIAQDPSLAPVNVRWIVTTLFYWLYPMIPVLMSYYLVAVIFEEHPRWVSILWVALYGPKLIFDAFVLANPFTGFLFRIAVEGYIPGNGEVLIFGVAILYAGLVGIGTLVYWKRIQRSLAITMLSYVGLMVGVLLVQYRFPNLVLAGTGSALSILILYLNIQNKDTIIDHLTGLMNRRGATELLKTLDQRRLPAQLILVSLKDFKTVNDLYGTMIGDLMLKKMASYLTGLTSMDSVYRYSGDMFLVVNRDVSKDGRRLLDQLMKRFETSWETPTVTTLLDAKFVYAEFPLHAQTPDKVIALLEFLIAKIKMDGNTDMIIADSNSVSAMKRRSRVIDALKQAVLLDRFEIALQPIYTFETDRYHRAEVLLRLKDPELGPISPGEFIPYAEEAGLIVDIGRIVTRKALALIADCHKKGLNLDALTVNYSVLHMTQPNLAEEVTKAVQDAGCLPSVLKLEITESIFINDYDVILRNIQALNRAGIGIYLDDFGTGFSNFANVVKLPLEVIKFDRSVILESFNSPKSSMMIKGLVETFALSGFPSVAEGIETAGQEERVKELGFVGTQGYLRSKPLSPHDFIIFLQLHQKENR
jgi:diguanylate cyclase (GGDEF)-like protein